METNYQICPICNSEIQQNPRYPNYVYNNCYNKATGINGRKLSFGNIHFGGGFSAVFKDTLEKYDSHICYIDKLECIADEARFGGIVIELKK